MSRKVQLLEAAAEALEDGRDPFGDSFLIDNEVTGEECMALSDQLALGAHIVAWMSADSRRAVDFMTGGIDAVTMRRITAQLRKTSA